MPDLITTEYNIFDLGYSRDIIKNADDSFYGATPELANSITSAVAPILISSGGLEGNIEIIDGYLQSSNFVTGVRGWKLEPDSAEFNVGVSVESIHIPDETTANSFHTNDTGNSWWGCNVADFDTDNDNANAYVLNTGVFKLQSGTISGGANVTFISDTLDTSSKYILKDFTFGTTDYSGAFKSGDIAWNSTTGAITSGSGIVMYRKGIIGAATGTTTFSIDATTGNATFAGTLSAAAGTLGSITAGTLTGVLIRTAASGERIEMDSSNIIAYDSSGNVLSKLLDDDNHFVNTFYADSSRSGIGIFTRENTVDKNVLQIEAAHTHAHLIFAAKTGVGTGSLARLSSGDDTQQVVLHISNTGSGSDIIMIPKASAPTTYVSAGCVYTKTDGNPYYYNTAWREIILDDNANWVDLTDSGETSLHTHPVSSLVLPTITLLVPTMFSESYWFGMEAGDDDENYIYIVGPKPAGNNTIYRAKIDGWQFQVDKERNAHNATSIVKLGDFVYTFGPSAAVAYCKQYIADLGTAYDMNGDTIPAYVVSAATDGTYVYLLYSDSPQPAIIPSNTVKKYSITGGDLRTLTEIADITLSDSIFPTTFTCDGDYFYGYDSANQRIVKMTIADGGRVESKYYYNDQFTHTTYPATNAKPAVFPVLVRMHGEIFFGGAPITEGVTTVLGSQVILHRIDF